VKLTKGAQLGPYEIVAPLGAGGMGEVYRARDHRLGRFVAIKILSADVLQDPRLLRRFDREARAIAALNHPNVCALYDIGAMGSNDTATRYIVMECLEGETLDQRLKRGALPLDEVIRYGIQISDALDKAHRKQIVHRDLKPANIMITNTGVRLFDFGLAKVTRDPIALQSSSYSQQTTPEQPITSDGTMVGTLEYMAPEQLQGKESDVRTDVFSFGVCLYQMITGRRPFHGSSRAGLIAAILEHEPPPMSVYQADIPHSLEWLVGNCLIKDPDERIQTAHDVMLELRRIAEEQRPRVAPERLRARRWIVAVLSAIALLVVVGLILISMRLSRQVQVAKSPIKRFSIVLPASAPIASGGFEKLAVSPEGTRIAYVGGDSRQLYLYSVETQETKALSGTAGAVGPFFSPDGEWIGFSTSERELKKIAVKNGTLVTLTKGVNPRGATWGADNNIVYAETYAPLHRVSASGGVPEILTPYESRSNIRWPSFLPGGEWLISTSSDFSGDYDSAKLTVHSLKTGRTDVVIDGGTYGRYVAPGTLLYFHAKAIFAAPFDAHSMRVTGTPTPIVSDVDYHLTSGLAHFAVASDGSLFYLPRVTSESDRELVWVDRDGAVSAIPSPRRAYDDPRLSPDGARFLVTIGPASRSDIWMYDIGRNSWNRVTTEASNSSAIWSPDGKQIAFASNRNGKYDLFLQPADGSGRPTQVTVGRTWDFPSSWSPDGKHIAVVEQFKTALPDIFVVAPERRATPVSLIATPFDEVNAVFSPDGHWIAYQSDESGRDEIYVQSYPVTGRRWVVSTTGGANPMWRADGSELFYRSGSKMMSVSTKLTPEFTAGKPETLFKGEFSDSFDVTLDGRRFLMVRVPKPTPRTEIKVVLGLLNNP